ncbi:MAG: methylenetetrahydrofolate reductase [Pseudonocardia sp.]|nr:methylenetetrahydrofolate reductase [Pseudonocardia sp.]
MHYGPCGGVRDDGSCEVRPQPCPFATLDAAPPWAGSPAPMRPPPDLLTAADHPVVLTDLTLPAYDPGAVAQIVDVLAPTCDAVLVGEHQSRPDLPPTLMATLIKERGVRPWITLTCRDRNRVVLEQELHGLAALGGVGVFCATGDGRAPGVRDEVTQVFDIDGTRLAGMAAHIGLPVGVPEAPDAPPRHLRPGRLLAKQEAGAQVVVLNHVGTVERLARFVVEARAAGVRLPFVAGVAVYTDERSAAVLLRFPGLGLDPERVEEVLAAPDPVAAGCAEAVREARAVLAVDGVVGVNLSGLASGRGERAGAEIKAAIGAQIRQEAA